MIADRKLSFHNNLQHSVCFHVFIYPDTEGPWSGPDYPIDCSLGHLKILLKYFQIIILVYLKKEFAINLLQAMSRVKNIKD
jgi:hypothetical protein